ncbi:MAG: hypothetical protein A4E52_01471 [Pelotomaculum sp. PtaB.Bin013]|uniref:Phage holin n=1 Tax=Pelotomaculum isophthalicicum JI TaxID=947010 RepID=A0A9X4JVX1_9FIRM|nr:phage holin [Pelotomaculum isophthalicicum]MDF9408172.1 phage holin [Pelotomaculum isophthalicicum JI]OPX86899.1 MAG: hypothetical protein A4E52_01471 [Pelotomaculum sp. PtaB.Bin013]
MQEQINQYATEIFLAVIGILVVLAKAWLKDLKQKAEAYLELKTTAEQRKTLNLLGKEAFSFAETVYKDLNGVSKLEQAKKYLEEKAVAAGIKLTVNEIKAAIEAAWLEDKRKEYLHR